jgi:hypothetical protein
MKYSSRLLVSLLFSGLLAQGLTGCGGRTQVVSPADEADDGNNSLKDEKKGKAGAKARAKGENSPESDEEDANPSGQGFHLPGDRGGQWLADKLPPHRNAPLAPSGVAAEPQRRPGTANFDPPELPLPPNGAELPQPPLDTTSRPLRPHAMPGDGPLDWNRADPVGPRAKKLPEARRVRLPHVDVDEPLPLPALGQAQPDRAPLTNPTSDISRKAATAGSVPARTTPAPFIRTDLPDPFENQKVIRLRKPPPEELPKNIGSQPPVKGGK